MGVGVRTEIEGVLLLRRHLAPRTAKPKSSHVGMHQRSSLRLIVDSRPPPSSNQLQAEDRVQTLNYRLIVFHRHKDVILLETIVGCAIVVPVQALHHQHLWQPHRSQIWEKPPDVRKD